jgi:hypothetical protein
VDARAKQLAEFATIDKKQHEAEHVHCVDGELGLAN